MICIKRDSLMSNLCGIWSSFKEPYDVTITNSHLRTAWSASKAHSQVYHLRKKKVCSKPVSQYTSCRHKKGFPRAVFSVASSAIPWPNSWLRPLVTEATLDHVRPMPGDRPDLGINRPGREPVLELHWTPAARLWKELLPIQDVYEVLQEGSIICLVPPH